MSKNKIALLSALLTVMAMAADAQAGELQKINLAAG